MLEPENVTHLKPWLVKTLEPICDAEPGALADYILALLKHNAPEPELRKELTTQLEEFLEKECSTFIDTLFTALRTKSYLPYAPPSPPPAQTSSSTQSTDIGIPIPLDGLLNTSDLSDNLGRKRSFDQDEHDLRPAKGPRLNADGHFSRYGRPDGRGTWQQRGERGGRMNISGRADYMDGGMSDQEGVNGRGYRERRGICRDYHNSGYCARGAFCKYSHGDDAVIPAHMFPMNSMMSGQGGQMPYMPMVPNGGLPQFGMGGGSNAPYDPHERMDMRPIQGGPVNAGPGRPNNMHMGPNLMGQRRNGEPSHIQDLTPQAPPEERMEQDGNGGDGYKPAPVVNGHQGGAGQADVEMGGSSIPPPTNDRGGGFRGHRGAGVGGGPGRGPRGTFGSEVPSFQSERRNDKTLVVEKIPEDKLSLGAVNEWFSKFGTVTNVAVDAVTAKALVSFANHDEAVAAWRSEDAVFGNRFVKVFWHRPMEGHGQKGAKMLAASAPLVANIGNNTPTSSAQPATSSTAPSEQTVTSSSQVRKPPSAAAAALAAKQQLLEQQIAEQKSLMEKLSTASPTEKKEIMARLRKLNEEMKPSLLPSAPSPAPTRKVSRGSTPKDDKDKEAKAKELLDKELDLHAAVVTDATENEESTEDLKAKLAKLKAEAASLGLDTALESSVPPGSSHRPYRGRGRGGRSYYRGAMRGGPPPRASMKLDNRPRKLLVKGTDATQAVRDWYETTGQVDTFDTLDSGDILVGFKSRAAAEQGLAKGSNIAAVGPVQIIWYTGQSNGTSSALLTAKSLPSTALTSITTTDSTLSGGIQHDDKMHLNHDTDSELHHEEEPVAGGWGADDAEDGFGML